METDNIQRSLGNLEGTIKTGFEAINKRLDSITGSVKTHEDKIDVLGKDQAVLKTKAGFIGGGASVNGGAGGAGGFDANAATAGSQPGGGGGGSETGDSGAGGAGKVVITVF